MTSFYSISYIRYDGTNSREQEKTRNITVRRETRIRPTKRILCKARQSQMLSLCLREHVALVELGQTSRPIANGGLTHQYPLFASVAISSGKYYVSVISPHTKLRECVCAHICELERPSPRTHCRFTTQILYYNCKIFYTNKITYLSYEFRN